MMTSSDFSQKKFQHTQYSAYPIDIPPPKMYFNTKTSNILHILPQSDYRTCRTSENKSPAGASS